MKAILPLALLSLSGCAQFDMASEQIKSKGAEVNDRALAESEFVICQGASVGSVKRRYNTPELIDTWASLCNSGSKFKPGE